MKYSKDLLVIQNHEGFLLIINAQEHQWVDNPAWATLFHWPYTDWSRLAVYEPIDVIGLALPRIMFQVTGNLYRELMGAEVKIAEVNINTKRTPRLLEQNKND